MLCISKTLYGICCWNTLFKHFKWQHVLVHFMTNDKKKRKKTCLYMLSMKLFNLLKQGIINSKTLPADFKFCHTFTHPWHVVKPYLMSNCLKKNRVLSIFFSSDILNPKKKMTLDHGRQDGISVKMEDFVIVDNYLSAVIRCNR